MTQIPTIALLDWAHAKALAQPIRTTVFVTEQGVPVDLEWDEWDELSLHAIGRIGTQVVGTGRLLPVDMDGSMRIGRMAVLRQSRGQGVGAAILEALLSRAHGQGAREAVLHAQSYAAAFYRRFGFRERGGEFFEAGISHVEMALPLNALSKA